MFITKTQEKILAISTCLLSDLTLVSWLYYKTMNYNNFNVLAAQSANSPDFQIQLYKIILQSLTFFLLLFFIAQSTVYFLAWKKMRAAYLYLKFFCVFGFAVFSFITVKSSAFGFLPMIIYVFGYYVFAKLFTESSPAIQSPQLT